ncbi:GAF domain-containing protein (plasmid) [Vibrio parahaemolyticus]|uniref:GAF domain-containing protein n=1 Tax=Vibrio parahaemolyticus TaxID=670 RepID=A0AAX1G169_VIBPH|nr:GAF domain-containing protein [Vibrio parahaemolyticus]EJE4179057.1 GAF domain-containing protein [Vibrio parahaemolyticus]MCR9779145.1 GAF domain-containing protein [Vibrio parahaemolyticus]MCZ6289527.1 GAF domain-containing protein [Vibrio parahaemolyticus]MDF4776792.1 GAF domain-containing protein [Vibrio parahaemolyticus]MDG2642128.1 GAF domain-containing protein [Vibrio parahaemolyticus]
MANIKIRKRNQKILRFFHGSGAAMSLFVGSVIQLDLQSEQIKKYPIWGEVVRDIKSYAPTLLFASATLIVVTYAILKSTNSVSILKCLQAKLNSLRGWLCCDIAGDIDDNHRVTLFKHKKTYFGLLFRRKYWATRYFPWTLKKHPWSGWLVPVARSGYTGQNSRSVFWAPDNGNRAEGVAGIAWAKGGDVVHFEKLPKIASETSQQNRERYCNHTKVSPMLLNAYVEEGKSPARSFLAFSLLVDGEAWGVVVVDSQSAEGIDVNQISKAIDVTCTLMPVLLEEL